MIVFRNTHPAITDADLDAVETRLGIVLPPDLRAFYLRNNGGTPEPAFFKAHDNFYNVEYFTAMNVKKTPESFEELFVMMVLKTPEFPRGYIPFAVDEADDFFLYSVRKMDYGSIWFARSDFYGDEDFDLVVLAPSLSAFLDGLCEDGR